jgi:hypothetical protein
MKVQKFHILLLLFSILSYIGGCFTIKYQLFPYNRYREWKNNQFKNDNLLVKDLVGNSSKLTSEQLFDLIKDGGYVIQFRHTHRDRISMPTIPSDVDLNYSCDDGANLSALGKEQAKAIRSNLTNFKIPIEKIYSSPACRLKEMSEILFPDTSINYSRLLFYDRVLNEEQITQKKNFIHEILSRPLSSAKNRFILGHHGTYNPGDNTLAEGHAFIYKPNSYNGFEYLGEINLSTWIP